MQKCKSKMKGLLSRQALIFPKNWNVNLYLKATLGDIVLILTTVVLGASTLNINRCFPRTTIDCLASALSFPSSVCRYTWKSKDEMIIRLLDYFKLVRASVNRQR